MKRLFVPLPVLAVLTIVACEDGGPVGPRSEIAPAEGLALGVERAGPGALGVMTWNIYVGADLTQLLAAGSLAEVPCVVNDVWDDVLATDFEARAEAIVDQIEIHRPHVIGLNEVSTFDFAYNTSTDLVFLAVLQAELVSRGLSYSVPVDPSTSTPAASTNFQVTLPIEYGACPSAGDDALTYIEYDVILVRDDVSVTGAENGNFTQPLPLPLPGGGTLDKYSGWASVDIVHKGLPYRVFATHPEPADVAPCTTDPGMEYIHDAQVAELMGVLDASPHPTVLLGDLNSDATGCTTDTYPDLIEDGFVDAWLLGRPRGEGFTANQSADLQNPTSALFHRIDFVLYRDAFTAETGRFQGSARVDIVGEEPGDRVLTALSDLVWPSDHAGVVAMLRMAPGLGHAE